MKKPVRLEDILEALELPTDDARYFLYLKTGHIVLVSDEDFRAAETDTPLDNLPEWRREAIQTAIEIEEDWEDYVALPDKYDVNEYEIMEDFCFTVKNPKSRDSLLAAIKGKGAFGRFESKVQSLGITDDWHRFRTERLKQIATEWCQDNDIEYILE